MTKTKHAEDGKDCFRGLRLGRGGEEWSGEDFGGIQNKCRW